MTDGENKLENFLLSIFAIVVAIAAVICLMVVLGQALAWLETGKVPPRDLFWITADVYCPEGGEGGWEGKDICRPASIVFTDWVGANKIINFAMDTNIAIVTLVAATLISWLILAIIDALQDAAINRARKRGSKDIE